MNKRERQLAAAERWREKCQKAYDRTRSHVWLARLRDAVTRCLKLAPRSRAPHGGEVAV